jgi:hypothetical protein
MLLLVGLVAVLGAVVLLVSQFTTLYQVHVATAAAPIRSGGTGSNHAYALAPVAVLAALLAFVAIRQRSRPALAALGVLSLTTLAIALLVDLPDARATGLVTIAGHYVDASATPSAGLYLETLAAVLLLVSAVFGLVLLGVTLPKPAVRTLGPGDGARQAPNDRRSAS